MLRHVRLISFALVFATPAAALDVPLPTGASSVFRKATSPDSYAMPVAAFDGAQVPSEAFEGEVSREVWRIETGGLTNLQLTTPIRDALEAADFEILLDCASVACGGFEFRFGTEVLPPPEMFVDLADYRFLAAKGPEGAVGVLASGTSSMRFMQIIRVGKAARAEVTSVKVTAAPVIVSDLGAALETTGRVVLDDLSFQTGSSDLSEGSYETLETLAAYLNANPARSVALVGHTDAVGSLDGNIALSRRRAQAVLERLASTHDVPRGQMEAGGMGYLAPRTTNLTDEGRTQNRRVEAVLTSTE